MFAYIYIYTTIPQKAPVNCWSNYLFLELLFALKATSRGSGNNSNKLIKVTAYYFKANVTTNS